MTSGSAVPPALARESLPKIIMLLYLFFNSFLMDLGSLLIPIFDDFLCFLHSVFEHDSGIVFPLILVWIFVSFLMVF